MRACECVSDCEKKRTRKVRKTIDEKRNKREIMLGGERKREKERNEKEKEKEGDERRACVYVCVRVCMYGCVLADA